MIRLATGLATGLSSFDSCLIEGSDSSIAQVKLCLHFIKGVCAFLAATNAQQGLFGQVQIFHVLDVLKDGFTGVKRFGAACFGGKIGESVFDIDG
jgi:hypothetical protein